MGAHISKMCVFTQKLYETSTQLLLVLCIIQKPSSECAAYWAIHLPQTRRTAIHLLRLGLYYTSLRLVGLFAENRGGLCSLCGMPWREYADTPSAPYPWEQAGTIERTCALMILLQARHKSVCLLWKDRPCKVHEHILTFKFFLLHTLFQTKWFVI